MTNIDMKTKVDYLVPLYQEYDNMTSVLIKISGRSYPISQHHSRRRGLKLTPGARTDKETEIQVNRV